LGGRCLALYIKKAAPARAGAASAGSTPALRALERHPHADSVHPAERVEERDVGATVGIRQAEGRGAAREGRLFVEQIIHDAEELQAADGPDTLEVVSAAQREHLI